MIDSTSQLQCKNCGGELSVDEQGKYLLCPFCGSRRLIIEGDAVTVEKIRQQTAFKQWEREDNERKEREHATYKNSRAGIVSLVFAIICGVESVMCFSSARNIFSALNGIVFLLQTICFLLSFLERKEVINLQKHLPFDGIKLPSLLMTMGFLLFIPSLILSAI